MSFLTPIPALVAAAVAVPLLLLLYFLKLRRQPLMMASTLLWRKSIEDLEVNAPFQRLRWSWLLLLQLLLLASLLLALAQPVLEVDSAGRSDRVILIIDRSGSMNALDAYAASRPTGTGPIARLEAAKNASREIIERLGRGGGRRQVMIISAGRFAEVVSGFESRRQALLDAIDSIEPTDEQIELQAAFDLAGAFAGRDEAAEQPPPEVVLISDGRVDQPDDAEGFSLQAREFRFLKVGPTDAAASNIGIVAFSARRRFDDPAAVQIFARLLNAGTQLVTTAVTLRVDDQAFETRTIDVPAADAEGPGEASVTFELQSAGAALLSLVQSRRDPLAADDAAAMVLRPPPSLRVALVYPDPQPSPQSDGADPGAQAAREAASGVGPDPFLAELIQAMQPAAFQAMTRSSYRAINPQEIDSGALYDLVIFDRVGGEAVPGIPSTSFGAAPAGIDVIAPSRPGGQRVLSWDRQHPMMQQLSLDSLVFSGFGGLRLPADATPLAFGPDGPIIAVLDTRGSRHVIVGFELMRSNWPTHVSIAVFMQNAVDYLTLSGRDDAGLTFRPGEPITVRALPEATRIMIDGPLRGEIEALPGAPVTLPPLRLVGVYRVNGAAAPMDRVAVSMLSAVESDLRPREELIVNARPARAGGVAAAAPLELWPWLAAIALGLLIVEWLVYLTRRRV